MSVDLRHGVLDPPLPVPEGERWPAIASLWERAKFLFRRVIAFVGSSERLARRERISRRERRDLLDWLEPVEKIVRGALMARAATWLTKTAEGMKLLAETRQAALPERAAPAPATGIPHPGWNTIVRTVLLDPDQEAEPEPQPERVTRSVAPAFGIVRWLPAGADEDEADEDAASRRSHPCSVSLLDTSPSLQTRQQPDERQQQPHRQGRSAVRLARRIDALAAVLDDPEPAFRRFVRFLARLPRGAISTTTGFTPMPLTWHHAERDVRAARGAARIALEALIDWEPG